MGISALGEMRTNAGLGWKLTRLPNQVVNSRAGRVTATTAAQSLTRTTGQGWPLNSTVSPP